MISSRLRCVLVWYTTRVHIADLSGSIAGHVSMELPYGERDRTAPVDQYASIFFSYALNTYIQMTVVALLLPPHLECLRSNHN